MKVCRQNELKEERVGSEEVGSNGRRSRRSQASTRALSITRYGVRKGRAIGSCDSQSAIGFDIASSVLPYIVMWAAPRTPHPAPTVQQQQHNNIMRSLTSQPQTNTSTKLYGAIIITTSPSWTNYFLELLFYPHLQILI